VKDCPACGVRNVSRVAAGTGEALPGPVARGFFAAGAWRPITGDPSASVDAVPWLQNGDLAVGRIDFRLSRGAGPSAAGPRSPVMSACLPRCPLRGKRPAHSAEKTSLSRRECLIRMRVREVLADVAHVDLPGLTSVIVIVNPGGD
jgi:hypothetical protein